jgi:hypothetical protein
MAMLRNYSAPMRELTAILGCQASGFLSKLAIIQQKIVMNAYDAMKMMSKLNA